MSRLDRAELSLIYESLLEEMDSATVVGNSGSDHGGDIENSDFYAPGDTRRPKLLGVEDRKGRKRPSKKDSMESIYGKMIDEEDEELPEEDAEGQCTKVTKKASSSRDDKKWMKCAKQPDGSIKRVHWGDPNAKVTGKSGNTKRKKSFRARHNCSNAKQGSAQAMACNDW